MIKDLSLLDRCGDLNLRFCVKEVQKKIKAAEGVNNYRCVPIIKVIVGENSV